MDASQWISIVLVVSTAAIVATYYYYKNAFSFWQKQGLAGPRPYPILGNLGTILTDRLAASKWTRQFGKIYGIYEGSKPVLVISDADLMGQLCIKDFNKIPNHTNSELNSELTRSFIISTRDNHWRHIRANLSPTFTSGKMRRMFKLIDICADNMAEAMQERLKTGPVVNLKDLFNLYTMDAIASCCYGIRLMSYKSEANLKTAANQDDFVNSAMKLFDFSLWKIFLIACLHESIVKKIGLEFFTGYREQAFASKVEQIIKKRRESGKNFDDYLQTLIDSKLEATDDTLTKPQPEEDHLDMMEKHHSGADGGQLELNEDEPQKLKPQEGKHKPLSEIEVLSNATFLLIVGLETTSTLLTNCVYALSFHQTIQDRLYETIKRLAKTDDEGKPVFDYDSLTSCHYLDAVVSETLRLHPPAPQTDRQVDGDYHLESPDLHLPKGTKIVFQVETIMQDPDYWNEPNVFDPERFMPEQRHKIKTNSYCPFGIGPRHCLGMRFSLTESKIALAKLMIEYKFEPAPGTTYPPEPKQAFGFNNMKRPEVMVTKRTV